MKCPPYLHYKICSMIISLLVRNKKINITASKIFFNVTKLQMLLFSFRLILEFQGRHGIPNSLCLNLCSNCQNKFHQDVGWQTRIENIWNTMALLEVYPTPPSIKQTKKFPICFFWFVIKHKLWPYIEIFLFI